MLSDGSGGKEGKNHEPDGNRLQAIPLPFGYPPSKPAGKQISDQDGELDLLLTWNRAVHGFCIASIGAAEISGFR